MKPVRFRSNVPSRTQGDVFSVILIADDPRCQVGAQVIASNGRFVIVARNPLVAGRLQVVLKRDARDRKQRRSA